MNDRKEIAELERKLAEKREAVAQKESRCRHNWGPIEDAHIYHEAYMIPGDPVGTMGIDWRGPCYVEARTERRWKRTCRNCGKIEYTSALKEKISYTPSF